ncbi:hypothetical protein [Kordiimonas lacus]|uniref:Uncharacterized protein n=1 Tax=Kordiimonas lacus TaxID=637679 RepID=A0A1G6U7G5_9PROT|nr:hypothetical protein [Kordiimonas lacus]SDD36626.1 hypothetical protein SAMN04488071_0479 [Kordiimonas lacus]
MNAQKDREPDLIDFLSDVNMQILHISKNMEDVKSNAEWVDRLQSISELIARYDYRSLQQSASQVQQNLQVSQELVNRVKEIGANTITVRKRFIRQFAAVLTISTLLLMVISAYVGAMYLPGRPHFGTWSCRAIGGYTQKQQDGTSVCYYIYH